MSATPTRQPSSRRRFLAAAAAPLAAVAALSSKAIAIVADPADRLARLVSRLEGLKARYFAVHEDDRHSDRVRNNVTEAYWGSQQAVLDVLGRLDKRAAFVGGRLVVDVSGVHDEGPDSDVNLLVIDLGDVLGLGGADPGR